MAEQIIRSMNSCSLPGIESEKGDKILSISALESGFVIIIFLNKVWKMELSEFKKLLLRYLLKNAYITWKITYSQKDHQKRKLLQNWEARAKLDSSYSIKHKSIVRLNYVEILAHFLDEERPRMNLEDFIFYSLHVTDHKSNVFEEIYPELYVCGRFSE